MFAFTRFPRFLGLLLSGLLTGPSLLAQGEAGETSRHWMQFESKAHDFGKINEADGPVKARFSFRNQAGRPLKVFSVKASCGCTTPSWPRELIQPSQSGQITAVYNPRNRPGRFQKSIQVRAVTTDQLDDKGNVLRPNQAQVIRLELKGQVIPAPKGPEERFPYFIGGLRFSTNHLALGRTPHNGQQSRSLVMYNQSADTITLKRFALPGDFLAVEPALEEQPLGPKDSLRVTFHYDASAVDAFGFKHDRFSLRTDDPQKPNKSFYVSANLYEDFSHLSPDERAKAPVLAVDQQTQNFGAIDDTTRQSTTFELRNKGKQPLLIRNLKTSCACLTATQPAKPIPPGETYPLKVSFDPSGMHGPQNKILTLRINAPETPVTRLTVRANIRRTQDASNPAQSK